MWRRVQQPSLQLTKKLIFFHLFSSTFFPNCAASTEQNLLAAKIHEMGKRKSGDDSSAADNTNPAANPWELCKLDSKGLIRDLHIKQIDKNDDDYNELLKNGAYDVEEGGPEKLKQKLAIYQGKRIYNNLKRLPALSGQPPPQVTGFRSITLHGVQDWENGIDEDILQFLQQISPLVAQDEAEDKKFCLDISLPYAFKGHQAANFGKNLARLLAVPGIKESIGALSYSEGGGLSELLARFPVLDPDPAFLYRYDVHVYCENDTLVEDYYADVEQWLTSQWSKPAANHNAEIARQARLRFDNERGDVAEEMLKLIKENFNKAVSAYQDRRTFVVRIDCPGFSLEPFHIVNPNTSEILALEYKDEEVLKADLDNEDFVDEEEGPPEKREKAATSSSSNNGTAEGDKNGEQQEERDDDDDDVSVVLWKSYKLVRASDGNELSRLMVGQLPVLKRRLNVIH